MTRQVVGNTFLYMRQVKIWCLGSVDSSNVLEGKFHGSLKKSQKSGRLQAGEFAADISNADKQSIRVDTLHSCDRRDLKSRIPYSHLEHPCVWAFSNLSCLSSNKNFCVSITGIT